MQDGEDELGCNYSMVGVEKTNRTIPCKPEATFGEFSSRFSNSTLYHRTPISNFLPSLLHPGAPAPLALANAEAQISAFQGHSFGQIFVLDLNMHCAGTYFATARTIVAMAVTKAKIVVLVSLQPSSSALNSSATVTLDDMHC